jgi:hypothetical protein
MTGLDLSKGRLAEWVFRLALVVALLYLSSNYVSLKDYKIDEARRVALDTDKNNILNQINVTLARIDERMKLDDTRGRLLKLEERVVLLEKKIP